MLECTVVVDGGLATVSVSGDLDMVTVARLRESVDEATRARPDKLVLDLSAVTFLDSAGLGALVTAHHRRDTTTRIVANTPETLRPIQITGLDTLLHVFPTREEAVGKGHHG